MTPAMLKDLQLENSRSEKTELRELKRQYLDKNDNKEKNSLDEDEAKIEYARYVVFPFIFLSLLPQKVSNHLSDWGKKIKSINHLVFIPKICYLRSANFALEFPGKGSSKAQKKIYISRVREGLESHSASTSFIASVTNSYHRLIREYLESYLLFNYRQDLGSQLRANQRQGARFYYIQHIYKYFQHPRNHTLAYRSICKEPFYKACIISSLGD